MDCTDLVIGMARGNYSRIGDFYSRDRSTPQMDGFYGGRQDLTAALGYELNGETVILFRRKLNVSDETDHIIGTEPMHVIWARGQEAGKYVHQPASGLEKDPVTISDFYRPDELKYHGRGDQRGVTLITFLEEKAGGDGNASNDTATSTDTSSTLCKGEWKYPVTCDPASLPTDCLYHAQWKYLQRTDEISFTIMANYTDKWVGIGFSESASMPRTDVVLGWVDPNGRVFVGDMWAVGYTAPKLDASQDLSNTSGTADDGVTVLSFTRKRLTNDTHHDINFTDDGCLFFKFPVSGGVYNAVNKKIGKHLQTPFVSDRICIKSCGLDDLGGTGYSTTPSPPKIYYNVGMKLLGLANNFQVPQIGSPEFNSLAGKFSQSVENSLTGFEGFDEVIVTEFTEDGEGLVAHMSVILDKSSMNAVDSDSRSQTDSMMKSKLQEAIASGRIGSINVDPSYLLFESQIDASAGDPLESSANKDWSSSLTSVSLYSVIACIIVLVVIAIIQASCTIYKVNHRKPVPPPNKEQVAVNWRDYSSTNYAYEPFEVDELRAAASNGTNSHTLPASRGPGSGGGAGSSGAMAMSDPRTLARPQSTNSLSKSSDRSNTYSLPRSNPRTNNSNSVQVQPDFYFMPSQRRYSGYPDYPQ